MSHPDYDVIIVGGRCAGASLALRLSKHNLKILLVDRATFPSSPAVPSSPFIQPSTMRLLDELGIPEQEYSHEGSKVERLVLNMAGYFDLAMDTSVLQSERKYFVGIDRVLFDNTLWKHASASDNVTAKQGFGVTAILKNEAGLVYGISGKSPDGDTETFTADLIVGADGRFSFCARQFGAPIIDESNGFTSAAYYADWENVDDYSPDYPNAINTYNSGRGYLSLVVPIAERRYAIALVMRTGDADFGAQAHESAYLERLQSLPHLWNRLKTARRVTDVVGIRRIENGYRQSFGENWALVGDAAHYKDPSDGQGIYDALLGSKLLAQSILEWKQNHTSWTSAGKTYQTALKEATYPTFKRTVANVKQSLNSASAPAFVMKTMGRWLAQDANFQAQFLRYLAREIPPSELQLISPQLFINGIAGDIRRLFNN